jgi:hypothetical protein
MMVNALHSKQKGLVTVEFALVGLLFFTLLFAIIEFSRGLFVWNAVADATRLGARAAAVCTVKDNVINQITRYEPGGGNVLPLDITDANVQVRYLDENGDVVADPTPANEAGFLQVRYVEVSIINYKLELFGPGLGTWTLPPFTATRPRESLGIVPGEANSC